MNRVKEFCYTEELQKIIETDDKGSRNETIFARANEWYLQKLILYPVPPGVPLDGNGALDVARELQWRIKHWAYIFRLTMDDR